MGEEGPGRKARGPGEEEEDLIQKLVVWLWCSKVLEELLEKALHNMILKIGIDNPLYHALYNSMKYN
jgi:hypothetical protein